MESPFKFHANEYFFSINMHKDYLSDVLRAPFRGDPFLGLSLAPRRLELWNFPISMKENVEETQMFLDVLGLCLLVGCSFPGKYVSKVNIQREV